MRCFLRTIINHTIDRKTTIFDMERNSKKCNKNAIPTAIYMVIINGFKLTVMEYDNKSVCLV